MVTRIGRLERQEAPGVIAEQHKFSAKRCIEARDVVKEKVYLAHDGRLTMYAISATVKCSLRSYSPALELEQTVEDALSQKDSRNWSIGYPKRCSCRAG